MAFGYVCLYDMAGAANAAEVLRMPYIWVIRDSQTPYLLKTQQKHVDIMKKHRIDYRRIGFKGNSQDLTVSPGKTKLSYL
jgi:hypothetical protein